MTTTQPVTSLYESVISALGGPADTSLEVQLAAINVGPDAPSAALDGRAPIVRIMAIDSIAGASSPSLVDARRALLLAGREEVAFGPAVLARLLRKNALISAAALSGAALDDLKSAVENQEKQLQKYMPALVAAVQKFDAMVASGDQSQTSTCLSALDDLAAATGDSLFTQWQTANLLWRVCCFSRSRELTTTVETARMRAKAWAARATGAHFVRWLDQAVAQEGPVPTSCGIRVAASPLKVLKRN